MCGFQLLTIVYLLFLASASIDVVAGRDHYIKRKLSFHDLCNSERIIMDSFPDNKWEDDKTAMIVEMPDLHGHLSCELVIDVPNNYYLLAVIQNMMLRGEPPNCIDYIQFRDKHGLRSERFCGKTDYDTVEINSRTQNYPRGSFGVTTIHTLIITLHISSPEIFQPSYLIIAFTLSKWCVGQDSGYRNFTYRGNNVCIREQFFCDGYRNCLTDMCSDEDNCAIELPDMCSDKKNCDSSICRGNSNCHRLPIGIIVLGVLLTIAAIAAYCVCKKFSDISKLCNCAKPSSRSNILPETVYRTDVPIHSSRNSENIVPTAPFSEESVTAPTLLEPAIPTATVENPPPPYDSLFPEKSH